MIKKHLLGGALLVAALFLLTGCDEIMSSLDNPVNSYLQLKQASVTIYRGQSFKMSDYYSTISDAKPVFTSADEKIALVDENGVVTGANRGKTKITVEIPATPYYNAATAEFEVEVDALLNLPTDAKEFALNEEYNLGVTSVSTGAITYKSSNTNVATVDANGNVTAKGYGDATITISIAATPEYDRTETAEFAATVRVLNYDQLKALIAENTEVTAILGDNAVITANGTHSWAGKKITITGNKEKPATIILSKVFYINDNFKIENVNIDATNLSNALIKLDNGGSAKLNEDVYPDAATKGAYYLEEVTLNNVMIKNLKQNLIHTNSRDWALDKLNVTNCIIQLDNDTYPIVQFNSGTSQNKDAIKNITFKDNTIYNINAGSNHYFVRFKNASNATGMFGPKNCPFEFVFENNTLINVSKGQKFGDQLPNNAQTKVTMKNNIYVDVKTVSKIAQGNCTKTLTGNYGYGSGQENSMSTKLDEAPFTSPTEPLDLTKKYGGLNLKASGAAAGAGDPRWNEIN